MALCDKEFAQEVADVERRLRNMALGAIKQGIDGWRQFMREEAKATLVARATSLEVQPGEGMTEARRRLAEEPVCLPASSFALKIGATRRRRALTAIDLDAVEAAKIKSFANGEPPVTVTAEQMALEDLGDSTVRVTIVQAEGGPTAQDITAAATLPAFLASMAEELGAPVGMEEEPTTISITVLYKPPPSASPSPPPPSAPPPSAPPSEVCRGGPGGGKPSSPSAACSTVAMALRPKRFLTFPRPPPARRAMHPTFFLSNVLTNWREACSRGI